MVKCRRQIPYPSGCDDQWWESAVTLYLFFWRSQRKQDTNVSAFSHSSGARRLLNPITFFSQICIHKALLTFKGTIYRRNEVILLLIQWLSNSKRKLSCCPVICRSSSCNEKRPVQRTRLERRKVISHRSPNEAAVPSPPPPPLLLRGNRTKVLAGEKRRRRGNGGEEEEDRKNL